MEHDKLQQRYRVPDREELDRLIAEVMTEAGPDDDLPEGRPLSSDDDDLDVTAVFLK